MLGTQYLKPAYGDALERALRATVPGMADYADLDSTNACASCQHWEHKPRSRRLVFAASTGSGCTAVVVRRCKVRNAPVVNGRGVDPLGTPR
jgi:hypothetical protein